MADVKPPLPTARKPSVNSKAVIALGNRSVANVRRVAVWTILGVAFLLLVHNFGLSLLPQVEILLEPASMQPVPESRAFRIAFSHSAGDTRINPRSRISLTENGVPFPYKCRL